MRVLRTGVHRRVHVAVPSVGDHLSFFTCDLQSGSTCLGEFEQRLTVLLLNHFFLHLSYSCVCKDWQLQLEPLSSSCVLGTLQRCPQLCWECWRQLVILMYVKLSNFYLENIQACKRMCHLIKVSSKMYFFFCHNSNLTTGGGIRAGSKSSSFSSIKYFFSLCDHCNDISVSLETCQKQ